MVPPSMALAVLIIAIALLTLLFVSSGAVSGRRLIATAIFSIVVTAGIVFIFVYLMDLNLDLFRWPA